MRIRAIICGLLLLAPASATAAEPTAPSISERPGWTWATASQSAEREEYRETRRICEKLGGLEPPDTDRPGQAQERRLNGCVSYNLYYGIGQPTDFETARACAFLETTGTQAGGDPFAGTGILMMIYANGRGTERDLDLATSLACRIDSAPWAVNARILHLQAMKTGKQHAVFDYCDDATSGYAIGLCAMKEADLEGEKRARRIDRLTKGWSARESVAFSALLDAQEHFASVSSGNEIDLSGSARGMFVVGREEEVRDNFVALLAKLEDGSLPSAEGKDAKEADAALNALYQRIMATHVAPDDLAGYQSEDSLPYVTVTHAGIRMAERAWIAYRDAWLDFAHGKFPDVSRVRLLTALTRERIAFLQGFVDND